MPMTAFITPYLKKISLVFGLWLFLVPMALGDGVVATRAEAVLHEGQLAISTRFNVVLPTGLVEALEQGIPLSFLLEFELTRPRLTAYYLDLATWFSPHASLSFRLSYQPLLQRYRVNIGALSNDYSTLNKALRAVGSIQSWRVLNPGQLTKYSIDHIAGRVRLILDISSLPRPYQLNALDSSDWTLSSHWVALEMKASP